MYETYQLMITDFGMSLCVVGWMNTDVSEKRGASIQYEDHNPGI